MLSLLPPIESCSAVCRSSIHRTIDQEELQYMGRSTKHISTAVCHALLLLTLASTALAQSNFQTLLVGVDHRTVTSLNGDWHYLVDQSPGRALYAGNGTINDKSYAMNVRPNIVGPHNEEYDFAAAPTDRKSTRLNSSHRCI